MARDASTSRPVVWAPSEFAAHVAGVGIREGRQEKRPVRIMAFRVGDDKIEEIKHVCVLSFSGR